MIGLQLQTIAQIAVGHVLNSLPEGMLLFLLVWMMLRFLPRQNSGTRFAVWFVALLSVAGVPLIDVVAAGHSFGAAGAVRPVLTWPLLSLPGCWGLLLFAAWVLVASAALLRLVMGLWRLRQLRRSCTELNQDELDPAIRETVAHFSTSRPVTLASSEELSVPAVLGFFDPMIVIPSWALRELPPEELNVVLLHEFAHLRRWDDWTNLLQKLVGAVFLFHPAVWWIETRLSLEREMACDDAVLAETANPRGYAKCLIALMEKSFARRGFAMAQAAVHRAREASLRLAQILDAGRPGTKHVWKPALGLVGAFSVICLMIVPRVPKFVAFEQNPVVTHTEFVQSASLSQPNSPSAIVIPAALHSSSSLSLAPRSRPLAAHVKDRHAESQVVSARLNAETKHSPVQIVTVNQADESKPEALFVIRTAQRAGPDSWVWSVSVWRIVLVIPGQDATERVPIAHKT